MHLFGVSPSLINIIKKKDKIRHCLFFLSISFPLTPDVMPILTAFQAKDAVCQTLKLICIFFVYQGIEPELQI